MKNNFFKQYLLSLCAFVSAGMLFPVLLRAQDTTHMSLEEVVLEGLKNSKKLHISSMNVDEALARFKQAQDAALPQISVGLSPSEAFILTRRLHINGLMKDTMYTPNRATLYLWNLSVNEPIFAGHKLKYAQESADLAHEISSLDAKTDSQDIKLALITSYINLYTIDENLKIAAQEMVDIQGRLDETIQFRDNGLATDNDVLRFKLEKANVSLRQIELRNNRSVANYALSILIGLPEGANIGVDSVGHPDNTLPTLSDLQQTAFQNRNEMEIYGFRQRLSDINIKNIKGDQLPTLGAGLTGDWVNPNSAFIPPRYASLGALVLGLNLSWNIASLYTSRHRMEEAKIQQRQVETGREDMMDQIRTDVQQQYRQYLQSIDKIKVLETAVEQAQENDRIMELKYQNQLAPTTDRIDAQTLLYQSLVNLSVAKADASTAYYKLMRSTGRLEPGKQY